MPSNSGSGRRLPAKKGSGRWRRLQLRGWRGWRPGKHYAGWVGQERRRLESRPKPKSLIEIVVVSIGWGIELLIKLLVVWVAAVIMKVLGF